MPDGVSTFQVYVTLPRLAVEGATMAIDFEATDAVAGTTVRHSSVFRGRSDDRSPYRTAAALGPSPWDRWIPWAFVAFPASCWRRTGP